MRECLDTPRRHLAAHTSLEAVETTREREKGREGKSLRIAVSHEKEERAGAWPAGSSEGRPTRAMRFEPQEERMMPPLSQVLPEVWHSMCGAAAAASLDGGTSVVPCYCAAARLQHRAGVKSLHEGFTPAECASYLLCATRETCLALLAPVLW